MSTQSWTEVFVDLGWTHKPVDGSPIEGSVQEFEDIANRAQKSSDNLRDLVGHFMLIDIGVSHGFRGQAAEAFGAEASKVHTELATARDIFGSLASVMRGHACQVSGLKNQATATLARARIAHTDRYSADHKVNDAQSDADTAAAKKKSAKSQIDKWADELAAISPDDGGYYVVKSSLDTAETDFSTADSAMRKAEGARAAAKASRENAVARLRDERTHGHTSWAKLRGREERLDAATADKVRSLELGGLADPGAIAAAFGVINDGIGEFLRDLYELGAGILTLDFDRAMFALKDLLSRVATVLGVVSIILLAVAIVAAVIPGGQALAGVAYMAARATKALSFSLGLAASLLTLTLAGARSVDPDTGESLGWGDVALAGSALVLAFIIPPSAKGFLGGFGKVVDVVEPAVDTFRDGAETAAAHEQDGRIRIGEMRVPEPPTPRPPEAFIGDSVDAVTALDGMQFDFSQIEFGGATTPRLCSTGGTR
jgi:uncharacterized protein YukE